MKAECDNSSGLRERKHGAERQLLPFTSCPTRRCDEQINVDHR